MNRIEYTQWCATQNIGYFLNEHRHLDTKKLEQLHEDLIPHVALEQLIDNDIYARVVSGNIKSLLRNRSHAPESTRSPADSH